TNLFLLFFYRSHLDVTFFIKKINQITATLIE
ncbi:MAG: hypothetical protein ACI8SZ_002046, partial [Colwellia sp.]